MLYVLIVVVFALQLSVHVCVNLWYFDRAMLLREYRVNPALVWQGALLVAWFITTVFVWWTTTRVVSSIAEFI